MTTPGPDSTPPDAVAATDEAGGYDSSLFAMRVGKDLRVLFALDDDPIFGRIIVTPFRAVPHEQMGKAYRETATALYRGRTAADRGGPDIRPPHVLWTSGKGS